MITQMEIVYRSKAPCDIIPAIFTTGVYSVNVDGREFSFDFMDMEATTEIEDGYLYLYAVQKNFDADVLGTITPSETDTLLRKVKKEDFTEIFYVCFSDDAETDTIPLEPQTVTFYDFSMPGDGSSIVVCGESFSKLE